MEYKPDQYEGTKPLGSIWTAQNNPQFVKTTLIDRLDRFIDSDFVSKDKDSSVKHFLKTVRDARKTVLDTIEPPKKSDETF